MGSERGGRRIKIVVHEKCGQLREFPLCSTGWKRPANAFEELVEKLLDAGITNDMIVYHSVVRYRLNRIGKNLEHKPLPVKESAKTSLTCRDTL